MKLLRSAYVMGIMGVLLGALLWAPAGKAQTFAGTNGKIVFSKTSNGITNIWSMNQYGGQKQKLTYGGANNPAWSPDGLTIAFINARGQLATMNSNGRSQRSLTPAFLYHESSPVWSADGSRIAFVRQETTNQKRSAIFVVKRDGSQPINVSGWSQNGGYRSPSWAPDNAQLVYERFGQGPGALLVKNIQTGAVTLLTTVTSETNSYASWSPNGKKILFNDQPNEVYTIWPDGSHRTIISDGDSYAAAWSPDGNTIAFLEDPHDDSISISQADGTVVQIPVQKGAYQEIGSPAWSPDGTKLLLPMIGTTAQGRTSDIFLIDLQKENTLVKLASGQLSEPGWQARNYFK